MLKKYFAGASQLSRHTKQNFSLGAVKRFTSARRSSKSEPLKIGQTGARRGRSAVSFPRPPSFAVTHFIHPTSPAPLPNPPVCSHSWQPSPSTPTLLEVGPDTDQGARPPACLPARLSLQVSFGSLTAPWRTGPSSATRASCPSQTLPQAWTGLTWLTQREPSKVTGPGC